MRDYIYDGTFDGLLTVVYHHYYTDQAAGIFTPDSYQFNFLQEPMEIPTDPSKADKVYRAIGTKISKYDLRDVYRAWLSCDPEKEMKILRYVVLGFQQGHRTSSLHSDPIVADFQAILQKISKESERMLQFVRFSVVELPTSLNERGEVLGAPTEPGEGAQEMRSPLNERSEVLGASTEPAESALTMRSPGNERGEVLYARIEPDNDVIELAARHFSDRFRNERIIIHDVGRNKAVIAYHGRWLVSAFAPEQIPEATPQEKQYRRLWKQYFDHIAILERKNTRCQNNFIPDRYRKHLTEIITEED